MSLLDMGDVSMIAPIATSEPAAPVDTGARDLIAAIEKRMLRTERAIARIAKTQNKNLPLFEDVIARIATMRESIHTHAQGIARVEKMAIDSATVTASLSESVRVITSAQQVNGEKLDNILNVITHARTWGGYARKYGKPLIPFAFGIAITRGWITAENGKNFLSIFGL